jgi:hypothetical protein
MSEGREKDEKETTPDPTGRPPPEPIGWGYTNWQKIDTLETTHAADCGWSATLRTSASLRGCSLGRTPRTFANAASARDHRRMLEGCSKDPRRMLEGCSKDERPTPSPSPNAGKHGIWGGKSPTREHRALAASPLRRCSLGRALSTCRECRLGWRRMNGRSTDDERSSPHRLFKPPPPNVESSAFWGGKGTMQR